MPQRIAAFGLGLLGLIALTLWWVWRRWSGPALRPSPAWLRTLLAAGLILLAWLGVAPAQEVSMSNPSNSGTHTADENWKQPLLQKTAEGRQVLKAIQDAAALPAAFKFTRADQDRVIAGINTATKNLESLKTQKKLDAAQVALILWELEVWRSQVYAKRPVEMLQATCYEPMLVRSRAMVSYENLQGRLPLLEELAAAKTLEPHALRQVVEAFQQDLVQITAEDLETQRSTPEWRAQLKEMGQRVTKLLDQIDQHFPATPGLSDLPEWHDLDRAWSAFQQPAITTPPEAQARWDAVQKALDQLASLGRIDDNEQLLLKHAAEHDLQVAIKGRLTFAPADPTLGYYWMSFESTVVPLVSSWGATGRFQPLVARKVLPALEADLQLKEQQFEKGRKDNSPEENQKVKHQLEALKVGLHQIRAKW